MSGLNQPAIQVSSLRRSYNGRAAVRGVSLSVARGEIVALLGPNGAGKTTTVEILEGFRQRDGGEVRVLGHDPASRAERSALRRRVGIVPQEGGHYRYLTVGETLQLHAAAWPVCRSSDDLLALVGLGDSANKRVRELSGGQQRRLDVAVALIGSPELLFLDEPTTGFDPEARRAFWQVIRELRAGGVTVLLTTHYLEEAQALADRVVVLADGVVVGEGTPAELGDALGLQDVIEFRVPAGVEVPIDRIAANDVTLAHAISEVGDLTQWQLRCARPTQVLAELCGWAVDAGVELEALVVRPPTLEDSYRSLTSAAQREPAGTV